MQNHGGWNSDDHQNNLLGRFRLSVTSADESLAADPLPAPRARDPGRPARAAQRRANGRPSSATGARPCPSGRKPTSGSRRCGSSWPEGTTALGACSRATSCARRACSSAAIFSSRPTPVTAGVPAVLHPLPAGRRRPRGSTLARWLVDRGSRRPRPACSSTASGRRTSARARRHERRLRRAERAAQPSGTARLAGLRVHGSRLEPQSTAPADRHSATYRQSSQVTPESYARDPYNRLLGPRAAVPRRGRDRPRHRAGGQRTVEPEGRRAERLSRRSPSACWRCSYGPLTWNAETGPDRYRRALYTFRRRSLPYPVLQNFDAPNGDFSCVRRQRSNTPLQALTTLNEVIFVECCPSAWPAAR